VTEPLKEILIHRPELERVWAIGPTIMMKSVATTTLPFRIPTIVSLNTIMIDGTGMCGGCRVTFSGITKFVCVDGPEFDAHQVDWESLLSRLTFYCDEEKRSLEVWKDHQCNLDRAMVAMER
jgi:ferredoxin--NADP+ reductase